MAMSKTTDPLERSAAKHGNQPQHAIGAHHICTREANPAPAQALNILEHLCKVGVDGAGEVDTDCDRRLHAQWLYRRGVD